jgi:hypothetical protein
MARGTTLGYQGITDCHKAGNVLCDLLEIIDVDFHVTDQLVSILNLTEKNWDIKLWYDQLLAWFH